MPGNKFRKYAPYLWIIIFSTVYLYILNPFHLIHREQMQLFRAGGAIFKDYLRQPGGISIYTAEFITQFFISPLWATILLILIFSMTYFALEKVTDRDKPAGYGIIPVTVLIILQGSHHYSLSTTIAFLFVLSFFCLYRFTKDPIRYLCIAVFPPLIFSICGGLWIWFVLLLLLSADSKNIYRYIFFVALSVLLVYIQYSLCYDLPVAVVWKSCIPGDTLLLVSFLVMLAYLLLLIRGGINPDGKIIRISGWIITIIYGCIAYDYKAEKLFEIEYAFYNRDYHKVTELVEKYPGHHHLVLYFGNIALSKTMQMGDKLFHFQQIYGPGGLYMVNEPVNISTLYGSELYRHLSYTGEALHYAYNGLIVNGMTPHLIKQLAVYELVNGNYAVAGKYLHVLSQTVFYRQWAAGYLKYVRSPLLIGSDEEMALMRRFTAYRDFYHDRFDLQLKSLLTLYPDNRAAFDYLVSYYLLKKDMKGFLQTLTYLREFRFQMLPVHYEEALLVCKNIFPEYEDDIEPYRIRHETQEQFEQYLQLFDSARGDLKKARQVLSKQFRHSFWFYLDFSPNYPDVEPNIQLFPY